MRAVPYTSPMNRVSKTLALILAGCISVGGIAALFVSRLLPRRSAARPAALPAAPMDREPLTMLWAWETPEDFTALEPAKAGVAFLSREVLLGKGVQVRPRHQPLRLAPATWLMAVVRIETAPDFAPTRDTIAETAQDIAAVAQQPNVRAIQVDFDATSSQHRFYAAVLTQLRSELPRNMPLSMTALVSWCGDRSWLHPLPIDEAVPMFFRMGGTAALRVVQPKDASVVREQLCSGSAGISTDETWPGIHSRERVYVFLPGSWKPQDLARINALGYQGLIGDLHR